MIVTFTTGNAGNDRARSLVLSMVDLAHGAPGALSLEVERILDEPPELLAQLVVTLTSGAAHLANQLSAHEDRDLATIVRDTFPVNDEGPPPPR